MEGGPLFSRSCKDANAVQQRLLLAASFGSAGLLRLPDSSRLSPDLQIFLLCAADCQPFFFLARTSKLRLDRAAFLSPSASLASNSNAPGGSCALSRADQRCVRRVHGAPRAQGATRRWVRVGIRRNRQSSCETDPFFPPNTSFSFVAIVL